jgi:hypothetical protein
MTTMTINVINTNESFGERGPFEVESIDAMVAEAVSTFIGSAARDIGADPDSDETAEQALTRLTEEFRDGLEIVA